MYFEIYVWVYWKFDIEKRNNYIFMYLFILYKIVSVFYLFLHLHLFLSVVFILTWQKINKKIIYSVNVG